MVLLALTCAIVDKAGSLFGVEIDDGAKVSELKKAIHKKKMYPFPVDKLQLFPAKTEGGANDKKWLLASSEDAEKLEKGEKTAFIADLTEKDHELQTENHLVDEWNKMDPPLPRYIHVLAVLPGHALESENKRTRKRMECEVAPDAWIKAIKDEHVAALPSSCGDLKEHLQRALHVKVPINNRLFQIVYTQNTTGELSGIFNKVFERETPKTFSDITAGIVGGVIDPIGTGSSCPNEATYHHFWDSLIAMVLRLMTNGRYRRNRKASTSTGIIRPGLCFYYKNSNVCVFRGEEKASGELQVPLTELYKKLEWRYDAAPYVFGYAAVGLQVCLVAIRKNKTTGRGAMAETIGSYDLGCLQGRMSLFLALLNISTLLRPVVELIQPLDILEYGTIAADNGVQIDFGEYCVVKRYPPSMPSGNIIRNRVELHGLLKTHSVPNVVELKKTNMKNKHVTLTPIGRASPPENVHQLLTALRDVLKTLVALHAIAVMHRDLRWENVLKYQDDDEKWFLIDFDYGAKSPAKKVNHLSPQSHAPEILSSSSHTVKVDIWSVGYLLMTSPVRDLPPELESMKGQCLQVAPSSRPTAETLLKAAEKLLYT